MSQIANKSIKPLTSNPNDEEKNDKKTLGDGIKKEKKRAALYSENLPTFYVGAGNNSEL